MSKGVNFGETSCSIHPVPQVSHRHVGDGILRTTLICDTFMRPHLQHTTSLLGMGNFTEMENCQDVFSYSVPQRKDIRFFSQSWMLTHF